MRRNFNSINGGLLLLAVLAGCAGGNPAALPPELPAAPELSLDRALGEASAFFSERLPGGAKIAITGVEAQTSLLSDYVVQELWQGLQNTGKFVMIDRRNQGLLENELRYAMSGAVADGGDGSAPGVGHFAGAEYVIHGEARPSGETWRLVLYASRTEEGTSLSFTKEVLPEPRFLPPKTLDGAVEGAVAELGRNLSARTRIGMDKISYRQYETVSDFSEYLKKNIIYKAAQNDKFEIVEEGPAAAALGGSFYPAEEGVVVMLHLVSTPGTVFIGAAKFTIPQGELDRNGVSVLPPNTSQGEIERVYRAIAPYEGKNNPFGFTLKSLRPDTIFYDGDTLSFQIYSERDCYFKITTVDVQGRQTVMYPVNRGDNNFLRGGETRTLPGNEGFAIDLHEPFGVEYVLAAAYGEQFVREPQEVVKISTESIKKGLKVRGSTRRELAEGAVVSDTSLAPLATARFSYTILPR